MPLSTLWLLETDVKDISALQGMSLQSLDVFWIQNARVLDAGAILPKSLPPAVVMRAVVHQYHNGPRHTRIFNHSINADCHCRLRHMSAWAARIS